MPWPAPLSGRGLKTLLSQQRIWRISREQQPDARASVLIVARQAVAHRRAFIIDLLRSSENGPALPSGLLERLTANRSRIQRPENGPETRADAKRTKVAIASDQIGDGHGSHLCCSLRLNAAVTQLLKASIFVLGKAVERSVEVDRCYRSIVP